jgi:hypothetical protein
MIVYEKPTKDTMVRAGNCLDYLSNSEDYGMLIGTIGIGPLELVVFAVMANILIGVAALVIWTIYKAINY